MSERPFSRSGLWLGHSWTLKLLCGSHSCGALAFCLGSLSCSFYPLYPHRPSRARCREASPRQDAPWASMIHAGDGVFMMRCSATWCLVQWPKSSVLVSSDHRVFFQLTSESLSYKTGEAPGQLLLSDWLDCLFNTKMLMQLWGCDFPIVFFWPLTWTKIYLLRTY